MQELHRIECLDLVFDDAQVDESVFSKRKYHRGRVVNQKWVFGMCDSAPGGKIYLTPIPDRKRATLFPFILEHTHCDSIVTTDCFVSYDQLGDHNIQHLQVNHSENFVDPETHAHTQRIESIWSGAKRWMQKHGYNDPQYIGEYLAEYCYRYNHMKDSKYFWTTLYE